jgi:rfaE bifunctional protein nucleotidyltransferase chain/domain
LNKKTQNLESLKEIRLFLRGQGKTVVFTNGCFDLIHGGHVHLFKEAKEIGDILIVAVNDDASVRKNKGQSRPIFSLAERLEILEAIGFIDYLVVFSEETPQKIISALLPDVLVKGGDWKPDGIVGRKEVENAGGRVVLIPYLEGQSTSQILSKIFRSSLKTKKGSSSPVGDKEP